MNVDLITLGCSKNLVDSEHLIRQLEANGYSVFHDSDKPHGGIVIINTCGFIGDAKEESINMILNYSVLRKQNKINRLLVMGCLSQRYRDDLSKEIPEVDKFYGKFDLKAIIADLGKVYRSDLEQSRTLTTPKHYSYIKIAEGCNRTCSYCAIPIITGKYVSRPIEDIEDEVKQLVAYGVKEFQIIAQDLTYYGIDLYKKNRLADLLLRLSNIDGVEWMRLHYAYPTHFPLDILPVMRERGNICKYLDIALQHSSDHMLQLMRRNITKQEQIDLINTIRAEVPEIHLRTTLMVGHPGETEEDFEELKDFVRSQRFERMGAFTYSDEDDTYANLYYKDDIPFEVKQARLDELMNIQMDISADVNQKKVGQNMKVIVDREEGEYYVGRTEFDSPEVDPEVLIQKLKDRKLEIGQFYNVRISSAEDYDLNANLIQ